MRGMQEPTSREDVNWAPWGPVMVRLIQVYMNLPGVPRYSPEEMAFRVREVLFELLQKVPDIKPRLFDPPGIPDDGTWMEMLTEAALAMTRVDGPPNGV